MAETTLSTKAAQPAATITIPTMGAQMLGFSIRSIFNETPPFYTSGWSMGMLAVPLRERSATCPSRYS